MATKITNWLSSLELDQYATSFEENDITTEDLTDLTDGDLKELGVASMGHRKKILRMALQQNASEPPIEVENPEPTQTETQNPDTKTSGSGSAERRQLTVMFADLVGSTEMAGRMDPEDMREAITLYQECVTRHVLEIEGYVAKYMGDGVLCYFGWPQAHEDDAERAARAALSIIEDLATHSAPNGENLAARIGIATGLVVVGDIVGQGAAQEEAVVGETPNLAARLQGMAEPGQIVVSDTTQNLLSRALDVQHLGKHELKGISRAVDAYSIVGEHHSADVATAGNGADASRLIGRATEISLLMDRWTQSTEGEGQVFLLCGEPGIGKSQIVASLLSNLAEQQHKILQFQCSPYYASSAFYPVIGYLERSAGFARDDDAARKLDKLETLLKTVFDDPVPVAALFASMLSLPTDRYPAIGLEPVKQREQSIVAFADFVTMQARETPLLFLFEDAHWCDATSLEILSVLIQRVENSRILQLITYRPEFEPPWQNIGHITHYNLNRLAKRHSRSIIEALAGGKSLPEQIVSQILEKTDGIPLFVEELTRTVLESDFLIENDDAYLLEGPLPPFAVPSSLQDSLMARLDRLSPLKDVAQTSACIGREFSLELLAYVSPQSKTELQEALKELVFNELIVARSTSTDPSYTFKHALVQDAAYSSLLKSRRQQLHANIANALQENFASQMELQPELMAQHLTAAGMMADAVPHWLSAGLIAISKSANEEAITHLTNGLNCLKVTEENSERDKQELLLRAMLGVAQFTARGYGSVELGENYENALTLALRVGDTPYKSPAMFGVWAYHLMRVNHAKASEVFTEAIEQARETGIPHEMTAALAAATTSSIFQGDAQACINYSESSWKLYDTSTHSDLVALFGQDVGLWCADFGSWGVWLDGRSEEADRRYGEANRLARELGHPLSLASGLVHASLLYSMAGDVERTLEYADETIGVCEEVGIPARLVEAYVMKGWALTKNGDVDEGIALTQRGMDGWRGAGAEIARPWWLALQAEQYRIKGDLGAAVAVVDEALSIIEVSGENLWLPELMRLRANFLLDVDANQTNEAKALLVRAVSTAERQTSKFWELRAATSLCGLMVDAKEGEKARQMLKPLLDGFSEGHETFDLRNARQMLLSV